MGLIRCPKCDAICHTEEEVCHYCGYRLKPEVKKEEPILDSDSLEDKKIETEEDPFAAFGYKEDPFEEYDKNVQKEEKAAKVNPASRSTVKNESIQKTSDEPDWVTYLKYRNKKIAKILFIISAILVILFITFIILTINDQEAVYHSGSFWSNPHTTYSPKVEWMICTTFSGFFALIFFIIGFFCKVERMTVKKLDGYYVAVSGYSNYWRLLIEGKEVDKHYHRANPFNNDIKLTGRLPNNKMLIVTIGYANYAENITFEVMEKSK